ncbi:MAG TPA: DUF2254 domain-containing protein [Chloroflexia bacterium]|nr:DUF2254 domain-containing protein [Chloroflexia bacterium]
MRTRILSIWDGLRGSYWFVPTLMSLLTVLFSFVTLQLDHTLKEQTAALFGYTRGVDGARSLLSTVAGSVMTVAGVVFSITVAALTLASSQFGPRLLGNFMRDTGNQAVLGTFISTFLYCLLILRTINGQNSSEFVPHISVSFGVLFAIASMGVLIYFIHHVASSIQADTVIARSSRELSKAIDHIFPEKIGEGEHPEDSEHPAKEAIPDNFEQTSGLVKVDKSGYIQAIDSPTLLQLCCDHDLIVRLEVRPGDFIVRDSAILRAWPEKHLDEDVHDKLKSIFIIGKQRTLPQDVEFAIQQLVEIAVRALSPGINDPFTAVSCIDRLGEALCNMADRKLPSDFRYDDENQLRVLTKSISHERMTSLAFDQIRQAARTHSVVIIALLRTIGKVIERAHEAGFKQSLLAQAEMLERGSSEGLTEAYDRQKVSDCYKEILQIYLHTETPQ